jgi:hypothetical protein
MEVFLDGPAIELHQKMRPLSGSDEEWERLVDVILETFHVSCFALAGVTDNREETSEMAWVSPGLLCGGEVD